MFKRCLILGGKGFIGSHLVEALISQGLSVRVFDRATSENLIDENIHSQVEFIDGDFADSTKLLSALTGCDICFHLISTTTPKTSNDFPNYDFESNVIGTINFLEQAKNVGLKKIIFLSSGGTVYGAPKYLPIDENHSTDPLCSYGICKLAIEKYLELYRSLYNIDYVVLRVSNPYGERQRLNASQGVVAVFIGKILSGQKITVWGDGSIARDYIYIGDLIRSIIATLNYSGGERIFNIGYGLPTTLTELLTTIEMVLDKKAFAEYLPSRSFDVPINVLNIKRAQNELKWEPQINLFEGLNKMKNWVLQYKKR